MILSDDRDNVIRAADAALRQADKALSDATRTGDADAIARARVAYADAALRLVGAKGYVPTKGAEP